jgi:predicted RNA binding protein YcfA (HicA-like mRNA interferase family)
MPPKIRELFGELQKSGFVDRGGKGSHLNFVHPQAGQTHHNIGSRQR